MEGLIMINKYNIGDYVLSTKKEDVSVSLGIIVEITITINKGNTTILYMIESMGCFLKRKEENLQLLSTKK